jgi:hypothetical protein
MHVLLGISAVVIAGAIAAVPMDDIPEHVDLDGSAAEHGAHMELVGADTLRAWSADLLRSRAKGPWHEYASASPCNGFPGRPGSDNLCGRAVAMCTGSAGDGPAVAIFWREVDRDGAPVPGAAGQWTSRGITCHPELVPGATRVLTMAMIQKAFHDTDFARPTVHIQPEGDVTLVNLPTYFQVTWPEQGFGPDEVDHPDPATLLGYRIDVRPRLKSVTYHLGETTIGPTKDLGGPYPDGDVVATYRTPGTVQVRVDVVYTGQFRVGGSEWFDIPGEVPLQGPPVTLTVREARARLYTG